MTDLIDFKDKRLIKIITGVRRCGKSTLLELYKEYLLQNGVSENQIISINFEDVDFEFISDYTKLHDYVKERLLPDIMTYVFLDEVQHVKSYEKAVDSLYIKKNVDVYVTGSNAYLLSGEYATLLSGRYVEIKMLPLSFKEYVSALKNDIHTPKKYEKYLTNSSFPYALELKKQKDIKMYLEGIYNSVILKDIVERKKISDVSSLRLITKFMFDNIGNLCSTKKIADYMVSSGNKISVNTVDNYLDGLTNSFILYKASRYDIKGKQYLKSGEKYYFVDIGLRHFLIGSKKFDMGRALENTVYLELLRRGYEVYIGKVGNNEVDFIAINGNGERYYQVALTVRDETTKERELKPLNSINDHNPKYLLTMDDDPETSHNGIKQINVLDWLLGGATRF